MKKLIITFSIMLLGIIGLLSMAYNTGSVYSGDAYTGGAYTGIGYGYSGDIYSGGVNTGNNDTGDNYSIGAYTVMYYYQENGRYTDGTMATRREGRVNETVYVTSSDKAPTKAGYVFDSGANNVLSGKIRADGSLTLKVYFKEKSNLINTGSNNTGNYNTGSNNTGNYYTGSNNTGNYNTGSNNTGNYYTGSNNTGNYNTGSNNTGSYTASYTVMYFYQKNGRYSNGTNPISRLGKVNETVYVTSSDKAPKEAGYEYDSSANNILSGKIRVDGSLTLKVYFKEKNNGTNTGSNYTGNNYSGSNNTGSNNTGGNYTGNTYTGNSNTGSAAYTVKYYYQAKGKYSEDLSTKKTRTGTVGATAKVTSSDKVSQLSGYEYDSSANNVLSGKIRADGSLTLKVYFKEKNNGTNTGNKCSRIDLNGDGKIDGADYQTWQNMLSVCFDEDYEKGCTRIDFNGDGKVDGADYQTWQNMWSICLEDTGNIYTGNSNTGSAAYTVKYYYQAKGKYSEDLSTKKTRTGTVGVTAKVTSSDKVSQLSGYEYDSSANNILSGKIRADGSLTLKVYFKEKSNGTNTGSNYTGNNYTGSNNTGGNYTGNTYTGNSNTGSAAYTVKYYYQAKGKYSEDLSTKKTRTGTVGTTAKVTSSDKVSQLSGYEYDSSANNVLSGKIKADGSLTLKVYFKEKTNGTNTGNRCSKIDLNGDGKIDIADYQTWQNMWSVCMTDEDYEKGNKCLKIDLNEDEKIDIADYQTWLNMWSVCMTDENDENSQSVDFEFGTISIENPDNPTEGITIMDRNLGATSNDISSPNSYGYHYQWGNNFGFSQNFITSSSKVSWNNKYNNHGYYGNVFRTTSRDYWADQSHDGLRGGESDSLSNNRGAYENNYSDRQGPCPDGYHVPSAGEWGLLVKYRKRTYDENVKGNNGQYSFTGKTVTRDFLNYFKLPLAGSISSYNSSLGFQNEDGVYWSSSVNSENEGYAEHLYISYNSLEQVYATAASPRAEGLSIRCFKNTYEPTNSGSNNDAKLTNQLTKTVEYKANEVSRKTVFNGTYKALKDTSFNSIHIEKLFEDECRYPENNAEKRDTMRFYLMIDGKMINTEFAIDIDECDNGIGVWFDEIKVKKGSSINVKIDGENIRQTGEVLDKKYKVTLKHSENFNMEVWGEASANLAPIKIVNNNEFLLHTISGQDRVYLKGKNSNLAEFLIKPSKGNSMHLNELEFEINQHGINDNDISLMIDGVEYEFKSSSKNNGDKRIICQPDIEIPSEGVSVKLILEQELRYDDYIISTKIKSINGETINKTFSKRFVSVLAYISKQENKMDYTKYTLGVEKYDDNYSIETLCMLTGSSGAGVCLLGENWDDGPFEDGYTFIVANSSLSQPINYITYSIKDTERSSWADNISIERKDYPDYFKVNGVYRKVYGNSSNSSDDNSSNNGSGYIGGIDNANYTGTGNGYNGNTQNSYSAEMLEAYEFAYKNRITTANTIEGARMYSPLTRGAMAKMLANYAINVLGKKPNILKGTPRFNDVTEKLNKQYDNAIVNIYQLGIMGQNAKNFRASDPVTRAEFATALSRMLYGTKDGNPYYVTHLNKLIEEGIINNTGNPKAVVLRGYAMLMLMRSAK